MAYEKRDMSGSLFKNDRKEKDTHADYRGDAIINGVDVWISAWIKEGKNGKFMSLAFKPKDGASSGQKPAPRQPYGGGPVDLDDSIPFAPEWR